MPTNTQTQAECTVICAVWSGDPKRRELLEGHAKNLDAQTLAHERIYVFDAADTPPLALPGTAITASKPLSIYAAWNLALALVQTRLVLNLNLDDRLAPDGLEQLCAGARGGADLVCGDWRICYSQAETDAVLPCCPTSEVPYVRGWPLPRGTISRLGSASERDTFGPACLWRMSLHRELPRYPWRFDDRTPVLSCGDWLFWRELQKRKKQIHRLQTVIGNYHSHPRDQAEFRLLGKDDLARGTDEMCLP